jgi:hypothetical protein
VSATALGSEWFCYGRILSASIASSTIVNSYKRLTGRPGTLRARVAARTVSPSAMVDVGGLDVRRRIVAARAAISRSRPGDTRFVVRLPLANPRASGRLKANVDSANAQVGGGSVAGEPVSELGANCVQSLLSMGSGEP